MYVQRFGCKQVLKIMATSRTPSFMSDTSISSSLSLPKSQFLGQENRIGVVGDGITHLQLVVFVVPGHEDVQAVGHHFLELVEGDVHQPTGPQNLHQLAHQVPGNGLNQPQRPLDRRVRSGH